MKKNVLWAMAGMVVIGFMLIFAIRTFPSSAQTACGHPVDLSSKADIVGAFQCAVENGNFSVIAKMTASETVGYGGLGEAGKLRDRRLVQVAELSGLLEARRIAETSCVSHAEAEDGAWGVLAGPWNSLNWPEGFSLPIYQEYILFQFREVNGEYRLENLLVGVPDCCGVGGTRPVRGAFYYPGSPVIRYAANAEECAQ